MVLQGPVRLWNAPFCHHHLVQLADAEALEYCRTDVILQFLCLLLSMWKLLRCQDLRHPDQLLLDAMFFVELAKLVDGTIAINVASLEQCYPLQEGLASPYLQRSCGYEEPALLCSELVLRDLLGVEVPADGQCQLLRLRYRHLFRLFQAFAYTMYVGYGLIQEGGNGLQRHVRLGDGCKWLVSVTQEPYHPHCFFFGVIHNSIE